MDEKQEEALMIVAYSCQDVLDRVSSLFPEISTDTIVGWIEEWAINLGA